MNVLYFFLQTFGRFIEKRAFAASKHLYTYTSAKYKMVDV